MINQKCLEIHSCVGVRYCKENKLLEPSGKQEQKWSDKKQTWRQAEPSDRGLSSNPSSSLGGPMCGDLALAYTSATFLSLSHFPVGRSSVCVRALMGGGGWGGGL